MKSRDIGKALTMLWSSLKQFQPGPRAKQVKLPLDVYDSCLNTLHQLSAETVEPPDQLYYPFGLVIAHSNDKPLDWAYALEEHTAGSDALDFFEKYPGCSVTTYWIRGVSHPRPSDIDFFSGLNSKSRSAAH